MQIPNGTGPGVRRSKRPLLASSTRCNVLWKPPKFGNKVKIGNKVQFGNKFANWCNVWSIECVIVYGHVPECHVTVISLRRVFDTTKVRQDYADYAGEMKICQSHIFVLVTLYFGAINFRILCVCLRKFRVNRSGSFCFIVLQNQSPRLLLTISGRRKFS